MEATGSISKRGRERDSESHNKEALETTNATVVQPGGDQKSHEEAALRGNTIGDGAACDESRLSYGRSESGLARSWEAAALLLRD